MDRQNYIELVTVPFQAGESKLFAISGQYFEIIDAVTPVDVVLTDKYGAQRGLMRGAEASFNLKATEFATVQLTSAAAQTVRFAYGTGEGGTRRAAGSVNIANSPTVVLQTSDMDRLSRPELPTGSWVSGTAFVANTPQTIFAPGANVNGAIVWMAEAGDVASGIITFLAKSSAPTGITDGEIIAVGADVAVNRPIAKLLMPQRLAAGLGLYVICSTVGAAGAPKAARFTLL